jgi:hypothetical protein
MNFLLMLNYTLDSLLLIYIIYRVNQLQAAHSGITKKYVEISLSCSLVAIAIVLFTSMAIVSQYLIIAVKAIDFVLGIECFVLCSRLLKLSSAGFNHDSYCESNHDFQQIRRKQFTVIKYAYLAQNVIYAVQFFLYLTTTHSYGCQAQSN